MGQNRKQRRDEKKQQRQAARQKRRDERQERRDQRREDRRESRLERIKTRQDGRTERAENRADARETIGVSKWEAKEEAYANGMDPDGWKGQAVGAAGSIIGGLLSGKENQSYGPPVGFEADPGFLPPGPENGSPISRLLPWIIGGLAAFFLLKGKKRK